MTCTKCGHELTHGDSIQNGAICIGCPCPLDHRLPRLEGRKFRKRPVVIEAIRYDGTRDSFDMIYEWANPKLSVLEAPVTCEKDGTNERLFVETLEGTMRADPGDWIVRGVKGEFYPCKPDIFALTYEAVN